MKATDKMRKWFKGVSKEFTPSTKQVRKVFVEYAYAHAMDERRFAEGFDRWLEEIKQSEFERGIGHHILSSTKTM
jgi:hypothetical protein